MGRRVRLEGVLEFDAQHRRFKPCVRQSGGQRDVLGRDGVVPGHHHKAHARTRTRLDRLADFGSGRVVHRHQAEELEVVIGVLVGVVRLALGDTQNTEPS